LNKITLILVVALLGSCLALVRSAYESRRVFAELDRAKQEQRRLDAEFKRLDAERQDQATHRRVERVAREKLAMVNPVQGATVFVADVPNAPQAGAAR
jgi:cell division protein FtsL